MVWYSETWYGMVLYGISIVKYRLIILSQATQKSGFFILINIIIIIVIIIKPLLNTLHIQTCKFT